MNIAFSLVLLIVVLVSGSIWAIDALFFAVKRKIDETIEKLEKGFTNEPAVVEF